MVELALVLLALASAAAAWLSLEATPTRSTTGLLAVAAAAGLVCWSWSTANPRRAEIQRQRAARPLEAAQPHYVTSDTCKACHPEQYASWHQTYHRTMTQPASPDTIVAPFDEVALAADDRRYHLHRRGDSFWITHDADRTRSDVVMVTGSHHQQRFWVRGEAGNALDLFPFAYLIAERRWVPGEAIFLMPPETRTEMAPGLWNTNCVACHSVAGAPGVAPGSAPATRVGELGIACEACHGPAEEHVRANANPLRRYALHGRTSGDPTIVNPARLSPQAASQVCGQCHGIGHFKDMGAWRRDGPRFRPAATLDVDRDVVRYDAHPAQPWLERANRSVPTYMEQHFWADGTVRISGREYNGLLESQCAIRGELSCLSCHRMHGAPPDDQLRPIAEGDGVCETCHDTSRFGPQHTHHPSDSPGSRCQNCHMPYITLGLLKAIRSHRIDSPHAETTRATGRPDACSLCHLDKPLAWTAERLTAWYGQPAVALGDDDRTVAASLLWLLRGDAAQRDVAASAFGWAPAQDAAGTSWMPPFLASLLDDPYPAVRLNAWRSLRSLPDVADLQYDYVADPAARRDVAQRISRTWRPGPRRDAAVLMTTEGTLDLEAFLAYRRQRDDRPVSLAE